MSKIFDKVKELFESTSNAIENIIKENKQYIEAELGVVKESEEGIKTLKEYAEKETPSLKEAISSLAKVYDQLETKRKEKVENLKNQFITPLQELLVGFEKRQEEMKEAEKAKKELDKARKKFEKEDSRPDDKKRPDKLAEAKANLEKAKQNYEKEQQEAKIANETFNKEKLETLKKVLNNIVNIEKDFHETILSTIDELKAKTEAIDVDMESKLPEE